MKDHVCALILLVSCTLVVTGCGGANIKDSAGERVSLSNYDRVVIKPVEVDPDMAHADISSDLTTRIRDRLSHSESWNAKEDTSESLDATNRNDSPHEIDLAVRIVKVRYPSRSKIIWLGSTHKMTCFLEVYDHATNDLLGSVTVSSSVEPLMGNAGLLNGGTIGIIGRACIDTREHDANSLLSRMAKQIVKVLDRARKRTPDD